MPPTALHRGTDARKLPTGTNPMVIRVITMAAVAMAVIDGIVVSIALPTITRAFSADIAQSQWILTGYLVTETSLLLVFGRVSEFIGKKRLFLAGLILFTTSSIACGLSSSLWDLVIFRALQAAGSAMIFSICAAILYETSGPGEQGRVMGYIGTTTAAAAVAAPLLGGIITGSLGWEYIFFINGPIGLTGIALFLLLSPPESASANTFSMDWPGAASLVSFLVFLVLSLAEVSSGHFHAPGVIFFLFMSVLSLFLFIMAERKSPCPLLDLTLFRDPRFLLPNMSMACVYIAFFMLYLVGPFYLEGALGMDPLGVGFVFLVIPVIIIVGSPAAGLLYDRRNARTLPAWGIGIAGASLFLLSFAVLVREIVLIIALFVPLSLGISLFLAPNATEIMRSLPLERVSLASSMSATLKNLGMIAGISLSALFLSLELSAYGYSLSFQDADPVILSFSIQKILVTGSIFCAIGAILSLVSTRSPGER
ncbi:MAG: MFS transporter [Methanolinea tarda]